VHGFRCKDDSDCTEDEVLETGNGPTTGKCVPNPYDETNSTMQCEIRGWCPVELENDTVT